MHTRLRLPAAALLAAAIVSGAVHAQAPAPAPKLDPPKKDGPPNPPRDAAEVAVEQALRFHPDIRVAEAKLREAEAELSRVRLNVASRVVELRAAIALREQMLKNAEETAGVVRARIQSGTAPVSEEAVAQAGVLALRASLEQARNELTAMTGEQKLFARYFVERLDGNPSLFVPLAGDERLAISSQTWLPATRGAAATAAPARNPAKAASQYDEPSPEAAHRLEAFLTGTFELGTPKGYESPMAAFRALQDEARLGLPIRVSGVGRPGPVALPAAKFPVATWLEMLADDALADVYVREYGLLVTPGGRGAARAMPVREFLKGRKPKQ